MKMTNTALTPQALSPIVAAQDLTEAELVKGIKTALSQMASSFRQSVKSAIEAAASKVVQRLADADLIAPS